MPTVLPRSAAGDQRTKKQGARIFYSQGCVFLTPPSARAVLIKHALRLADLLKLGAELSELRNFALKVAIWCTIWSHLELGFDGNLLFGLSRTEGCPAVCQKPAYCNANSHSPIGMW